MRKVLLILAPGFEEIESIGVVDILRRSGAKVTLAATVEGPLQGSRGVSVNSDCLLTDVDENDYDLLVLPGGQPGTTNLIESGRVLDIVKTMHRSDKWISAICAAPLVLQSAGILAGVKVTSHPSVKEKLYDVDYLDQRVVVDGKIITSRSPGTALEFALVLVDLLFGKDRMDKVNDGVMAKI